MNFDRLIEYDLHPCEKGGCAMCAGCDWFSKEQEKRPGKKLTCPKDNEDAFKYWLKKVIEHTETTTWKKVELPKFLTESFQNLSQYMKTGEAGGYLREIEWVLENDLPEMHENGSGYVPMVFVFDQVKKTCSNIHNKGKLRPLDSLDISEKSREGRFRASWTNYNCPQDLYRRIKEWNPISKKLNRAAVRGTVIHVLSNQPALTKNYVLDFDGIPTNRYCEIQRIANLSTKRGVIPSEATLDGAAVFSADQKSGFVVDLKASNYEGIYAKIPHQYQLTFNSMIEHLSEGVDFQYGVVAYIRPKAPALNLCVFDITHELMERTEAHVSRLWYGLKAFEEHPEKMIGYKANNSKFCETCKYSKSDCDMFLEDNIRIWSLFDPELAARLKERDAWNKKHPDERY